MGWENNPGLAEVVKNPQGSLLQSLIAQLSGGSAPNSGGLLGKLGAIGGAIGPIGMGAGALLTGLSGLFGGKSQMEKMQEEGMRASLDRRKSIFSMLQNRYGQSDASPSQYLSQFEQMQAPGRNRQASMLDSRLGLDSGVAAGELARSAQSDNAGFLLNQMNRQGDQRMQLLQLLASQA